MFDTLYLLLAFGHASPEAAARLDPPSSMFRIRLVCVLLGACGAYFCKGSAARRLDRFFLFFQRYLLAKPPLPLDVEFDVQARGNAEVLHFIANKAKNIIFSTSLRGGIRLTLLCPSNCSLNLNSSAQTSHLVNIPAGQAASGAHSQFDVPAHLALHSKLLIGVMMWINGAAQLLLGAAT